jgi:hypothetical protein
MIVDRKPELHQVLTDRKLDDTRAQLEHLSNKPLKCLAQEMGVSEETARTATNLLWPYRTTVHTLQPCCLVASFISVTGILTQWGCLKSEVCQTSPHTEL